MSPANEYTALPVKMLASGFSACFADFLTFPLDTAKVRLQVQGEKVFLPDKGGAGVASSQYRGMLRTLATITRNEGARYGWPIKPVLVTATGGLFALRFRALYNGLNAGLQRQLCFASVRIGLYDSIKSVYQQIIYGSKTPDGVQIIIPICAGITAGGLAVLLAQPTDVVKVRFQAQMSGNCSRYSSTLQAYTTIAKNEGFKGLWKGTMPNIGRNAIINVAETVSYDVIKGYVLRKNLMTDNTPCHLVCATITGFCATSVASPVDVIKTRYMNSRPGEYKGAIDCAIRTGLQEGSTAFYKGFTPSFYRLVSWNIVMWLTYEKIKKFCSIT